MQIIIYGRYCLRYKYILWYIKFFLSIFMILIVFMYYFCNREKRKSLTNKNNKIMDKYVCNPCGWIYDPAVGDPENGVEAGTAFENLSDDWVCPLCGAGKDAFSKM